MNRRLLTVLGFAFVVALGATLLFYGLIASRLGSSAPPAPKQEIVVAARNLNRGEMLKEMDVKMVAWGAPALPKGAFTDKTQAVGRGVVSEVSEGEPVLEARLAPKEAGADTPGPEGVSSGPGCSKDLRIISPAPLPTEDTF
jgi:pilus assembly protein CpaB